MNVDIAQKPTIHIKPVRPVAKLVTTPAQYIKSTFNDTFAESLPYIQRKQSCSCGGTCPLCREDQAIQAKRNDSTNQYTSTPQIIPVLQQRVGNSPVIQRKTKGQCLTLESMTAKGINPTVNGKCRKNKCRFGLGCCPTDRGKCGSSKTSGMVLEAVVSANKNCNGKIGFMQELIKSKRKKVASDGTARCRETNVALRDGAVPWKGCSVTVNGPGKFTITTDDCPSVTLKNRPSLVEVIDQFKTYLLWKPDGQKKHFPIANMTWGWEGKITKTKNGDCESGYRINSALHTDGVGKVSKIYPSAKKKTRDMKESACK